MSAAQHPPDPTVISWDIAEHVLTDGSKTFDVVGTSDECLVILNCVDERAAEAVCDLLNSGALSGATAERVATLANA